MSNDNDSTGSPSRKSYIILAQGMPPIALFKGQYLPVKKLLTRCNLSCEHYCRPGCWCIRYHSAYAQRWKTRRRRKRHNLDNGLVHDILTQEVQLPPNELKPGDYLVIPRLKGGSPKVIDLSQFMKRELGPHSQYAHLPLNEDWAYLLGLYISEGWTSKRRANSRRVCIALNVGEEDHVLAKVIAILKKYGFPTYVRNRGSAYEVSFTFTWLARWLDKYVGTRAHQKVIPTLALDMPLVESIALLMGMQDGDGCKVEYGYSIASTSQVMLRQIQMLLTKLGRWGSIGWGKDPNGRVSIVRDSLIRSRHPCGYIRYGDEVRTRHWMDADNFYIPVKSIVEITPSYVMSACRKAPLLLYNQRLFSN